MLTFDIARLFPRFLLNDKNGYAMAKAIEAGLKYFLEKCQDGLDCVQNVDKMPEWRLDEMAWELNCLYDYHADIESKRKWIRDAIPLFASYGTVSAIYNFLTGYFDGIEVEEFWQYNGNPFHFRVTVEGEWTPENEAWARRAIAESKNVRSVLDGLNIGCHSFIGLTAEGKVLSRFAYPLTGAENWAGRWPQENTQGVLDESARAGVEASDAAVRFPYPMAGTTPEINTIGAFDGSVIPSAQAEDTYAMILYKLCGQDEI